MVIAGATLHLLIYRTFSSQFTMCFCIIAVALQRPNKQGFIHASYHVAEMALFEYYECSVFLQIFHLF